ncbi:MAG: peptidase Imelysin [Devosia sp.]|uniref:imelysin family protein n=1 Tax=Devosia sp. TaxID=1871048 RepID=UPI00261A569C|nr:imelysin family protein [Devosia sp.]MDB5586774.1 peptidase Imelysin [Devosia sp.]
MRILLALLFAMIAGPAMAQLSTSPGEVMRGAVNNFIRPAMTDFGAKADVLSSAVSQLCTTPSEANLSAVDAAFGDTGTAFGRIEAIRVGPIMDENRAERLLFWPDRKGIALKQVQAILSSKDESATNPATLKDKSVAVQGLTALEFVLYGTGFETLQTADGAFRCRYGSAIAQSVAGVADELVTAWNAEDGIALHLMKPDATFTDFRTPIEAQEELVGILSHGIEAVRDTRLNPFLAKGDVGAKPKLALFWRSGLTVPMIRANVDGLQSLFALSGISGGVPNDKADLPASITAEFSKADAALDLVTDPVDAAVADPAQAQALADVVTATQQLGVLIGEQLSSALGLSVGFSSLDGD